MTVDKVITILTAVLGLVSLLLGWRSNRLKGKLDKVEKEAQDARKALGVLTTHKEAEKAIDEQESAKEDEIEEADDEESIVDIANDIIDAFNS